MIKVLIVIGMFGILIYGMSLGPKGKNVPKKDDNPLIHAAKMMDDDYRKAYGIDSKSNTTTKKK